ncbi:MAG: peptidylprolyl isomerase [Planctomycetaceae bacterium]|nr:peptidylprolyl isomerase [Planctomycetaceae bacterium]
MKKLHLFGRNWSAWHCNESARRSQQPRRISFEALESRCLLSVSLGALSNVTMAAGTTLYIPLAGSESGQTLSYQATASDYSKLTTVMTPQTNKSLQLNVSINGVTQTMAFRLFDDMSPATTAKIESLVAAGFYNGLQIYRNGKDTNGNPFVIQGGNAPPSGFIKTDQSSIAEEFNPALQYTSAGILAMARSLLPGTSSTEFFVTEQAYRSLDFDYTIFGFQTAGTDVVQTISAMANKSEYSDLGYLVNPVTITSASIFTDTQNGVLQLRAPAGVTGTVTVTVIATDGTNVSSARSFDVTIVGDTATKANPFAAVRPTAPTSVTLVSPTGTTNHDNSSSTKTLQFLVSGVTSGNEVEILADGNVIGHATATGTSVTITTDGSTALLDGTHKITAIQIAQDKTVTVNESDSATTTTPVSKTADVPSLSSAAITLTVDDTAPTFTFTPVTTAVVGTTYTCQATTNDSTAVFQLDQAPTGMTINASTGAISWTPSAAQSGVNVTVRATDTTGNYTQKTFAIDVLPVNTPPVLQAATPSMGSTNEATPITIPLIGTFIGNGGATTTITDADTGAVTGGIAIFNVTGNGVWEYSLDGTTFTAIQSVGTASALLLARTAVLRYTPDGKNGEMASISYRAWDTTSGVSGSRLDLTLSVATSSQSPVSTASDTAWLTVTSVNDAPVLTPASPSLGRAAPSVSTTINLATFIKNGSGTTTISDVDAGATLGGIALVGVHGDGVWEYTLDGTTFVAIGSVSQSSALLLPSTAKLRYTANAGSSETANVTYVAWDTTSGAAGDRVDLSSTDATGGSTAFSVATDTASLVVDAAPVLTPAAPSLGTTNENTATTIALTGTFINHGTGTTTITDANANDALGGIAIVDTLGNGTWAYSLDGVTFIDVGAVSGASALLLPSTAKLRYTPDLENGETASITYRAWDATAGQAGSKADTTVNGGAAAYSSATDTASLTVTSVNDAPVVTATSPSMGAFVHTTSGIVALTAFINNGGSGTVIADADNGAVKGGIALIGLTGDGDWQYSLDGTTFIAIPTVSATAALLLPSTASLKYIPSGIVTEQGKITYRAWDTTTGAAGGTADTTSNGADTAFSTATDTATLLVNDAPVLTAASPSLGTTILGSAVTVSIAGGFVNHGTGSTTITDANTNATLGGIAITAATGSGTWAYSLDGTTYTAFPTVSGTASLLLPSTAKIRYTPNSTTSETATITYRAWDASTGTAGSTASTATNGGATAFSSATDTASLTVAGGSISGYVFIDTNNDGLRTTSSGGTHVGLPGVIVKLSKQDTSGNWVATATTMSASDGSYHFNNLGEGTYLVQEMQPSNYIDGIETVGKVGGAATGTAGADQFQIALTAGGIGTDYNFGERGIKASAVSLQYLVWPAMSTTEIITQTDVAPAVYLSSSTTPYTVTYSTGGTGAKIAGSGATIVDSDSTMLASMTASITNLKDGSSETLAVDVSGTSVTSSYSGGVLTLTGVATLSVYKQLLASITYSNTASTPTLGNRTVQVIVNDGIRDSLPTTSTVTVGLGPLSFSVAASDSAYSAAEASSTSFTMTGAEVGAGYTYTITSSGGGSVTGSGTIATATQAVTGINLSGLSNGSLTYSVKLTDTAGRTGTATASATLDKTAPTSYSITAGQATLNATQAASTKFTFAGAEVGATYNYTVTSSGGSGSVTGSGTITSATQQITGINVSGLPEGTLTYSVTLTDTAGNIGAAATATTTFDKTAPTGYSIAADSTQINAASDTNVGFTFSGAAVGTTYNYTIISSGGSATKTGTGTVPQSLHVSGIDVSSLADGQLTFSVTLTDAAGNVGTAATATATLDKVAPSGYYITADSTLLDAATAVSAGFTFDNATLGTTYTCTITSSGGSGSVTRTGTIDSVTQHVTGIDVSSLPDGTLTYHVTLTDAAGNVGTAATATATLDKTAPHDYSVTPGQTAIDAASASATSFTFAGAEVGATYMFTITSSGGGAAVTGTGLVSSATQQVTGIDVSSLPDGSLTYSVTLTDTAGNVGAAAKGYTTLETGAPRDYTITADQSLLGAVTSKNASFTFANAEIGATYNYKIISSGGGSPLTGTGLIASATDKITVDVSSLPDGELIYGVTLLDASSNEGLLATATATLDRTAPTGYSILVDQAQIDGNATATSFTFSGAEPLATYSYIVTSSGGQGSVSGSGVISSATQQVTSIDVSALPDGLLTYSVTLTDPAGNEGTPATATALLGRSLGALDSALSSVDDWLTV